MKTKTEFSSVRSHHRSTRGPLHGGALAIMTSLAVLLATTAARATIIPPPPIRTASSGTINNAFDHNNSTSWISSSEGTNTTAQFLFGGPTAFDRVVFINHVLANTAGRHQPNQSLLRRRNRQPAFHPRHRRPDDGQHPRCRRRHGDDR